MTTLQFYTIVNYRGSVPQIQSIFRPTLRQQNFQTRSPMRSFQPSYPVHFPPPRGPYNNGYPPERQLTNFEPNERHNTMKAKCVPDPRTSKHVPCNSKRIRNQSPNRESPARTYDRQKTPKHKEYKRPRE